MTNSEEQNIINKSDFDIGKNDLSILKNYKNPPYMVQRIIEAVMMLLGKNSYPWTTTHSELCNL